ncbi:cation-transporting P-type ATPase [Algihabitans albus]|uniref:cation-transporting P-type ATPase n=1 Tax=Algihabitans albus TaxID=2164067 RepID=UPI000E5D54B4|nr:cation-transporting P-type ATPase [Algihabitans albus]
MSKRNPPSRSGSDATWHDRPAVEAMESLEAVADGLTDAEAERRRGRYGPNRLPEPRRRGPLIRFLRQFHNLLIYVLLAAGAITALLGHLVDTFVILAVVVVNAVIGFVQEGKAEQALKAIRDMLAPKATVLRAGRRRTIPGEEIVPGDLVILEAGDRVPADLRLLEVRGLRVQEAVLTGESLAVEKATDAVARDVPLGDRRSLAFSGTLVAAGQGRGLAVATGAATEIGRISSLIAEVRTTTTPLIRQMAIFAKWLTGFVLLFSALILVFGLTVADYGFSELFMAVVGLSVAAIPEGLPAILTVTLAIGVQGMARRNAIVRRLPAIEALGSVSVICSDKTGTLTKNEMTVASVATAQRLFTVSGSGYAPHGGFSDSGRDIAVADFPLLTDLAKGALLCSEAELHGEGDTWTVVGDPMEGALLTLASKAGLDLDFERRARPQTDSIPFDSQHRFMASLHHDHEGNAAIFVKGAPERLLQMSRHQRHEDGTAEALNRGYWHEQAEAIAARGQRVLAIASKATHTEHGELLFADVEGDLTLLGLVGLIDPPREEAIAAVAECRAAGIRVKMITGDHAGTAAAVARQLGLQNSSEVLEGAEIDGLEPEELRRRAREVDVFARTSPEHKLRLVEALQEGGAVVAMTGDGVNDAPALKRADVGIAMGGKGTEAAKEAAEIVLADDNFATIAAAVKAGRTVYDNLKKAIVFLLPVNGGESLSLVAAILLGLTLPITPVQILWVNMVSSVLLAMTLAFEPSEPGVMRRAPRPASEPILSRFVLWRVGFVSLLFSAGIFGKFTLAQAQGASVEEARTIAVNTLVVMEIFYLFSVRYLDASSLSLRGFFGTRSVLIAIAAVTALQFLFTYAPFMEAFFATRPLSLLQGLQVFVVGVAVLLVLELEKRVRAALFGGRTQNLPGGPDGSTLSPRNASSQS